MSKKNVKYEKKPNKNYNYFNLFLQCPNKSRKSGKNLSGIRITKIRIKVRKINVNVLKMHVKSEIWPNKNKIRLKGVRLKAN